MGRTQEERKNLGWIIAGIGFISFGILIFLSLMSYSPNDPSINTAREGEIHNWIGKFGAYTSDLFFSLTGMCAWLIPLFFILAGISLIKELSFNEIPLKALWLILSIVFGSVFFNIISHGAKRWGGGGIGGFLTDELFKPYFGGFGTGFLSFIFFLTFLLLFFGISPYDGLTWAGEKVIDTIVLLREKIQLWRERRRKRRERLEILKRKEESSIHIAITKTPTPTPKTPTPKTPLLVQLPLIKTDEKFELPTIDLLDTPPATRSQPDESELKEAVFQLEKKLRDFGVEGKVVEVRTGPLITVFEFEPASGVKVSKILNLADDLALGMKAESVRIVGPIPGKGRIGIEIANRIREKVYLSEIISSEKFRRTDQKLPLALGKDIAGGPVIADLEPMPHLLIAGTTGSGKSVCLHSIIISLLFKKTPHELRFIMIDTKMIELTLYNGIPHLYCEVVSNPKDAPKVLRKLVEEMETRFRTMNYLGARNIEEYNKLASKKTDEYPVIPRIVVVIDEMADLMITAPKEIEEYVTRLSQMARASGIHLVAATQRPSVDVVTGIIKANFPARIAFKVISKIDSRTILDVSGAEHLLGAGDMLFMKPGSSKLQRVHGAYVSHEEIKRVVEFLSSQAEVSYELNLQELKKEEKEAEREEESFRDERYEEAIEIVKREREISISKLQRRMRIGFNRAARIIEEMEKDGIIVKDPNSGKYIYKEEKR